MKEAGWETDDARVGEFENVKGGGGEGGLCGL